MATAIMQHIQEQTRAGLTAKYYVVSVYVIHRALKTVCTLQFRAFIYITTAMHETILHCKQAGNAYHYIA
jgi:hypothetical protein